MLKLSVALPVIAAVGCGGFGGIVLATPAYAAPISGDACVSPPAPVVAAIERGWVLLRLKDLNPDDQKLWLAWRPKSCPGFAAANMSASFRPAYIVALIDSRTAQTREKVILLVPRGKRFVTRLISKPTAVGNPAVVWRAAPGKYHEWDRSRSITISRDSVVLETIEASAEQYYFVGGQLRSLTTSD